MTGAAQRRRFIVFGVGAIGGGVAAALSVAGQQVVGIARGAQLQAIQRAGLRLRARDHDFVARFSCVAHPSEIDFQAGDIVLLTMKTQDTKAALQGLRDAGVQRQPLFCMQNGVANERFAMDMFPNVHGVTVMMPAQYVTPGDVAISVAPKFGMFDVGRAPSGTDADDHAFAQALRGANFSVYPSDTVMASKYGKLRMNLGNIVQAALGKGVSAPDINQGLREEFDQVMRAAGIAWVDVDDDPRRMEHIQSASVAGVDRAGGSTLQSLLRGTGTLETEYLNGEVVEIGRRNGVPTPLNARAVEVANTMLRNRDKPGSWTVQRLRAAVLGGIDSPT